jgi:hypothetical protein
VAIVDADLEEKSHKLQTTKTLKTAAKKQKKPVPRAKKRLKVDEETSQASPLEGGGSNVETPSTSACGNVCKKEESEDSFTFGQSPVKRIRTESCPQGRPARVPDGVSDIKEEVEMNWDVVQVSTASCHLCALSPGVSSSLCSPGGVLAVWNFPFASDFWNQALTSVSFLGYTICSLAYHHQLFSAGVSCPIS